MIVFRCFPWDREVAADARGGAVWFPRMLQGAGRHDNPLVYGCLYVSEAAVSPVVEQLARFVSQPLTADKLRRFGLPLSLAAIDVPEEGEVVDLDEPRILAREELRPSLVATHERGRTQADAATLFTRHPDALGMRWWSTFESQWPNVTLFDRASSDLVVKETTPLALTDEVVEEAAAFLGLRIAT